MILHVCYVLGRAAGAALSEIVNGFWSVAQSRVPAEEMTPDVAESLDIAHGCEGVTPERIWMPTDDDLDWLGWAIPAIQEVLAEHEWLPMPGFRPNAGQYTCACMIRAYIQQMDWDDWVDHVAPLIAQRCACDPARAITALWNYQLKQQTP